MTSTPEPSPRATAARRRIIPAFVLAGAGLLALTGCGGDDATSEREPLSDELKMGERVYSESCQTCHGNNGQGGVGPKLGDGAVVENVPDEADHRQIVVDGRKGMPAFGGDLSDEEIDAVVAYEREELGR